MVVRVRVDGGEWWSNWCLEVVKVLANCGQCGGQVVVEHGNLW